MARIGMPRFTSLRRCARPHRLPGADDETAAFLARRCCGTRRLAGETVDRTAFSWTQHFPRQRGAHGGAAPQQPVRTDRRGGTTRRSAPGGSAGLVGGAGPLVDTCIETDVAVARRSSGVELWSLSGTAPPALSARLRRRLAPHRRSRARNRPLDGTCRSSMAGRLNGRGAGARTGMDLRGWLSEWGVELAVQDLRPPASRRTDALRPRYRRAGRVWRAAYSMGRAASRRVLVAARPTSVQGRAPLLIVMEAMKMEHQIRRPVPPAV